jgi:hypothetical protein
MGQDESMHETGFVRQMAEASGSPGPGHGGGRTNKDARAQWEALVKTQGSDVINPCNSKLHPAVLLGIAKVQGEELCVQEAYTPSSRCFGCGECVVAVIPKGNRAALVPLHCASAL